jgi:hypothetical protein
MRLSFPLVLLTLISAAAACMAQGETTLPRVSIVGSVHDSVGQRPLVGATVQIVLASEMQNAQSATTDERGRYRFNAIVPGEYLITFFHPSVDSLAVQAPIRRVRVGARDPERIDLALPGTKAVLAAHCTGPAPFDSAAAIVGEVRDPDTRMPVADVYVLAEWMDFVFEGARFATKRQAVATQSSSRGHFTLCGVPGGGEISLRAFTDSLSTGILEVAVPPYGVVRRDLAVGRGTQRLVISGEPTGEGVRADTVLRGPGRLSGNVLNESGRPVSDAIVQIWNTGVTATTDEMGRFDLAALPVGTHTLEVRRIGFVPHAVPVDLTAQSPTTMQVTLAKPVRLLDAVRVTGRTVYSRRLEEIAQRQRRGFGHVIMRDELERSAAIRVSDVLRRVPGIRIIPSGASNIVSFSRSLGISGPCLPTVYLDGMRMGQQEDIDFLAMPTTLEAIEVYPSSIGAPIEYSGGCGSILLWTRTEPRIPDPPRERKP